MGDRVPQLQLDGQSAGSRAGTTLPERHRPPARVDGLSIQAGIAAPTKQLARLQPVPDQPGRWLYQVTHTRRCRLTATWANEEHLEWSRGTIGVRLRPRRSSPTMLWHVKAEQSHPQRHWGGARSHKHGLLGYGLSA